MSNKDKQLVDTQKQKDKPSPARGRKSTYDPKYCESIIEVARKGGSDAAMALACGLKDRKSLWRWRQKYSEFRDAYNYAKLIQLERDEAIMDAYILGKVPKGNYRALEKRLQIQDPERYGSSNLPNIQNATQINIQGDIKAIQGMDMGELDKKIQAAMQRLGPLIGDEKEAEVIEVDDDES
jgi:hypothetical protein